MATSKHSRKRLSKEKEQSWPYLFETGYMVTSKADTGRDFDLWLNCFAYAAGKQTGWWSPDDQPGYYWPEGLPRRNDIETFCKLYFLEGGYKRCNNGRFEPGIEKIALYVNDGNEVTHAARQKEDGNWTSKLGEYEDIEHKSLAGLNCVSYGAVAAYLQRPRKQM